MTVEEYRVLTKLVERKSYQPLANILRGIEFEDFQTTLLAWSVISRSCLITLDTGLGKTLLATAYMQFVSERFKRKKKFIYVCELGSMEQTLDKIRKHSGFRCVSVTGENEAIHNIVELGIDNFDVIVITYQGLLNFVLNQFLVTFKDSFIGIIVDECQHLGNETSLTSRIAKSMCKRFDYKLFLSATPFRTRPEQYLRILHILDDNLVTNVEEMIKHYRIKDDDGNVVSYKDLDQLEENLFLKVVGYTRKELGLDGKHVPKAYLVESTGEEQKATRKDMLRVIKGNSSGGCFKTLVNVLLRFKSQSKKGLIYCNTNENKRMLLEGLQGEGFAVGVIDGSLTKRRERPAIQREFAEGKYDVVITNITTGLDMQCDFILFWEMTLDFKQMIGRGERGLSGTNMDIVFILAKDTVELEYFKENVYSRSLLLRDLLGKDNAELETIMKAIE
jgi:superfamily II DNA or RNA helicase